MIESYRLILIQVEASSLIRFERAQQKYAITDLESFIKIDHEFQFMFHKCHMYKHVITVVNNHSAIQKFHEDIKSINFGDNEYLRPKWDTYFMRIAHVASTRTNCMKRAVGAVIVVDNRIVATGYNGTPFATKNCNEGGCDRCNSNVVSG